MDLNHNAYLLNPNPPISQALRTFAGASRLFCFVHLYN
jgi:hypothetical protein